MSTNTVYIYFIVISQWKPYKLHTTIYRNYNIINGCKIPENSRKISCFIAAREGRYFPLLWGAQEQFISHVLSRPHYPAKTCDFEIVSPGPLPGKVPEIYAECLRNAATISISSRSNSRGPENEFDRPRDGFATGFSMGDALIRVLLWCFGKGLDRAKFRWIIASVNDRKRHFESFVDFFVYSLISFAEIVRETKDWINLI